MGYQQSTTWKRTLAQQTNDQYEAEREHLRNSLTQFREKAAIIANEIARDMPDFTVHDISHIDALWDMVDIILDDSYPLNPMEAYVLGGAFLVHDLGMGLVAYRNGYEDIKKESIWKDSVAHILKKKQVSIDNIDFDAITEDVVKAATEITLRSLHARQAALLPCMSWNDTDGNVIYLMDDSELRYAYGAIIGNIAYSHWWGIERIENVFDQKLGALPKFPREWTVDSLKLACIIRIADAMQIDDRRSPLLLKSLRKVSADSEPHWTFQQKLYRPQLQQNKLLYTSKSGFSQDECDSWWLCYDTLKMIDKELKDVEALLTYTGKPIFSVNGIANIESEARLSKCITTDGWVPMDLTVKVNDVARLVHTLGGSQLYGNNLLVPLRELVQNATDAIRARKYYENDHSILGNIIINIGADAVGEYIEVSDNGIGMTQRVISGPLLDFGTPFWDSPFMHNELPGLVSKGFTATGKYGIGFYSVFMWGDSVTVTTKHIEAARKDTLELKFNGGVGNRAILKYSDVPLKDSGTHVKIYLKDTSIDNILQLSVHPLNEDITWETLLKQMFPALDCNLYIKLGDSDIKLVINADDWLTIESEELLKRVFKNHYFQKLKHKYPQYLEYIKNSIEIIKDETGKPFGRAAIFCLRALGEDFFGDSDAGIITCGGAESCYLQGIIGILLGEANRASRDSAIPFAPIQIISNWSSNQACLLSKSGFDIHIKMASVEYVKPLRGNPANLPVSYYKHRLVDFQTIKHIIKEKALENIILVSDYAILTQDNYEEICFNDNVFYCSTEGRVIVKGIAASWPTTKYFEESTMEGFVIQAAAEVWDVTFDHLMSCSQFSSDDDFLIAEIGTLNGVSLEVDNVSILKPRI